MLTRPTLKLCALLAMVAGLLLASAAYADPNGAVIYLVRHAEKIKNGDDPPLSEAGRERSQALSRVLKDAGIELIFSSDYRRTLETAEPLARQLGLEVEIYDPRALEEFAARLEGNRQRLLIIGHSNTTPRMVELLGGEPGTPINEDGENDRLYVLTGQPGGDVTTVLLRFGEYSGY